MEKGGNFSKMFISLFPCGCSAHYLQTTEVQINFKCTVAPTYSLLHTFWPERAEWGKSKQSWTMGSQLSNL